MRKDVINERLLSVYKTIGNNISRLRGRMNQEELAQKAGISRSTIYAAEQGESIALETLVKIADALGVHPADLFLTEQDQRGVSYKSKLVLQRLFDVMGIDDKKI